MAATKKPDGHSKETLDKGFWGFQNSVKKEKREKIVIDESAADFDSVQPDDDSTGTDHEESTQRAERNPGEDHGIDFNVTNGGVPQSVGAGSREMASSTIVDGKKMKGAVKKNKGSRSRGLAFPRVNGGKKVQQKTVIGHRKRRTSGKMIRVPQHLPSVSEGDMAQADEMGDGGQDDGFVDTSEDVPRRKTKRKGGAAVVGESSGTESLQTNSKGNSPLHKLKKLLVSRSFHQTNLRDQRRAKPRRRPKSSVLSDTDLSTQENTTPAPYSSDTHEDLDSSPGGESPDCPPKTDSVLYMEPEEVNNISEDNYYEAVEPVSIVELSPSYPPKIKKKMEEENSSAVTSDIDYKSSKDKRKKKPWKPNSDISTTGPLSTETSDIDTSANEQGQESRTQRAKKRFSTLFSFGFSFGSKSKEKGKNEEEVKDGSTFYMPSPTPIKRQNSEPQISELAKEEKELIEMTTSRSAITPEPARKHKIQAYSDGCNLLVVDKKDNSHTAVGRSLGRAAKSDVVLSIADRIAILKHKAGESDSSEDTKKKKGSDAKDDLDSGSSTSSLPARSSRIQAAIQLFEGHSTNTSPSPLHGKAAKTDGSAATKDKTTESAAEDTKPLKSDASETKPLKSDASETKPLKSDASETKPLKSDASETKPLKSDASETKPLKSDASETKPLKSDASETKPLKSDASETKPLKSDASETKPLKLDASETKPLKSDASFHSVSERTDETAERTVTEPKEDNKAVVAKLQTAASKGVRQSNSSDVPVDEVRRPTKGNTSSQPKLVSVSAAKRSLPDPPPDSPPLLNKRSLPDPPSGSPPLLDKKMAGRQGAREESPTLTSPSTPPSVPTRTQSKDELTTSLPRQINKVRSPSPALEKKRLSAQFSSVPPRESNFTSLGNDLRSFLDEAFADENTNRFQSGGSRESSKTPELRSNTATRKLLNRAKSDRVEKRFSVGVLMDDHTRTIDRIHRTPSMDALNDRTDRLSRHFFGSSSDEEDQLEEGEMAQRGRLDSLPPLPSSPQEVLGSLSTSLMSMEKTVFSDWQEGEEPLYQYVNYAQIQSTAIPLKSTGQPSNSSSLQASVYEALGRRRESMSAAPGLGSMKIKLWRELDEVIDSGVLEELSDDQISIQEAFYEIFTTENSYGYSLDVLISEFVEDPHINPHSGGDCIISKRDFQVLFSNVRECREVSRSFYNALDARRKENIISKNICDIIGDYASSHFNCYVRYISNQRYQEQSLRKLMNDNIPFKEFCQRKEKSRSCQGLGIYSFLLLPMQRITRLPLLVLAILNRMSTLDPEREMSEEALKTLQELVAECNDGAKRLERTEQLVLIHKQIDFGKIKPIPIVSSSRHLVKKGSVTELKVQDKLFGRTSTARRTLQLFSFSDFLIVAKKKRGSTMARLSTNRPDNYSAIDHCLKSICHCEHIPCHPNVSYPKNFDGSMDSDHLLALWAVSQSKAKYAFLLTLLENCERRKSSFLCLAQNETEMVRWIDALNPPAADQSGNTTYEAWDHPQFQVVFDYNPQQPDELSLVVGDVIRVFKKMADGWYYGENVRNLECGWFPSNYTFEMDTDHKRWKDLRQEFKRHSYSNAKNYSTDCKSAIPMGRGLGEVKC